MIEVKPYASPDDFSLLMKVNASAARAVCDGLPYAKGMLSMQHIRTDTVPEYAAPAPLDLPFEDSAGATIVVHESPYDYEIASDLPGVSAEDITVHFAKGVLTVTAHIETETYQNLSKVLVVDRQRGQVEQGFALPPDADSGNIFAEFDNGILKITIGKLPAGD